MDTEKTQPINLNRREFLKGAAAVGGAAVASAIVAACSPSGTAAPAATQAAVATTAPNVNTGAKLVEVGLKAKGESMPIRTLAVALSPDGKHLFAPAYNSGSVVVFERDPVSGTLRYAQSITSTMLAGARGVVVSPEGDALYHTLQVFELAKGVRPWDEEFLLAALLHDVGKGIDRYDHVAAGLQALDGLISPRTTFLIENHMLAHEYRAGTLGAKAKQRLEATGEMEDLLLLEEMDMGGRVPGAVVGTVDEAIAYLRELEQRNRG